MTRKTVVIHQPDFLPYLGFFERLLHADLFIVLDHVRLSKRGWVHRDKIKTASGESWISVPLRGLKESTLINQADIDRNALYHKIPRLIVSAYRQAPYFDDVYPAVEEIFAADFTKLADLNMAFLKLLFGWMAIDVPMLVSSTMQVTSAKSAMNAELVQKAGGGVYLSGMGAKAYHEQEAFDALGIEVVWRDFRHPIYPQLYGEFIPFLSTLDALFNCGIEGTGKLLRNAA